MLYLSPYHLPVRKKNAPFSIRLESWECSALTSAARYCRHMHVFWGGILLFHHLGRPFILVIWPPSHLIQPRFGNAIPVRTREASSLVHWCCISETCTAWLAFEQQEYPGCRLPGTGEWNHLRPECRSEVQMPLCIKLCQNWKYLIGNFKLPWGKSIVLRFRYHDGMISWESVYKDAKYLVCSLAWFRPKIITF